MSCESNCGQTMIESSVGCFTPAGGGASVTIDIYRTFMPDPNNLGKTILTETRFVKPGATGPTPFVPDFAGGDTVTIGACPLAQVVASANATGDLEDACYQETVGGPIVPVKIVVVVDPDTAALTVQAFSVPTLQPIVNFDQTKLVACPVTPCPTPTNTGINPTW